MKQGCVEAPPSGGWELLLNASGIKNDWKRGTFCICHSKTLECLESIFWIFLPVECSGSNPQCCLCNTVAKPTMQSWQELCVLSVLSWWPLFCCQTNLAMHFVWQEQQDTSHVCWQQQQQQQRPPQVIVAVGWFDCDWMDSWCRSEITAAWLGCCCCVAVVLLVTGAFLGSLRPLPHLLTHTHHHHPPDPPTPPPLGSQKCCWFCHWCDDRKQRCRNRGHRRTVESWVCRSLLVARGLRNGQTVVVFKLRRSCDGLSNNGANERWGETQLDFSWWRTLACCTISSGLR